MQFADPTRTVAYSSILPVPTKRDVEFEDFEGLSKSRSSFTIDPTVWLLSAAYRSNA
jgi:hypothetical protein